jgi:MFS family permease
MGCALLLSGRCELKGGARNGEERETEPLLNGGQGPSEGTGENREETKKRTSRFAQISRETLSIMAVLWFLLMVDCLADGMSNISLTSYYLDQKFGLPKSALGDIISASFFLAAASNIFAGPLARYIGLVNTMVFTHIPSSAAVLVFPFAQTVPLSFALLLLRMGLNNMDQGPRVALIAAVVRPEERTAVMGITTMLRTLASTTGPSITGLLAENNKFWVAFVVAGTLRLAYDVGLFAMFINIKLHKHETEEDEAGEEAQERPQESGAASRQAEP